MLEVCFSDSVKGSLKMAQNCGGKFNGAVGFIGDKKNLFSFFEKKKALKAFKKRQEELEKRAVPLGGCMKDIVGVSFGLSQGDIKEPIIFDDCPRKEHTYSMFDIDNHNNQENVENYIYEFWQNNLDDLEKLKSKPEKIRIWLDHTPDAQCGLLFIVNLLEDSATEISVVELPKRIKRDDHCEIEYRGWGEVEPELFGTFLDREKQLTKQEIKELSKQWQILKNENTSLRVVENGIVISAYESYYDDSIRKEFPKDSCKIANIIGNSLSQQKLLIGDVFIAKRIKTFIENGELDVLGNTHDRFYNTIVKCANKS